MPEVPDGWVEAGDLEAELIADQPALVPSEYVRSPAALIAEARRLADGGDVISAMRLLGLVPP